MFRPKGSYKPRDTVLETITQEPMDGANSPSPTGEFSSLLDEFASIARVRRNVEREYQLIKLSNEAKQRYSIDSKAYLELYGKYYAAASQAIRIRSIGGFIYRALVGSAALGAALSALNLYSFLSDQRGKAIADSWKTIEAYSGKPYDGGRRAAAEGLLSYGQVLYNVNFNRAPLVYLKAHPTCKVLGMPLGAFGPSAGWGTGKSGLLDNNCIRAELQNAEFRGAKLYGSNFSYANLYEADFSPFSSPGEEPIHTQAQHANFYRADLQKSHLEKADMHNSNFKDGLLKEAYLQGANLSNSDLTGADLRGADLRGAILGKVLLCGTLVNGKTLGIDLLSKTPASKSCHKKAIIMAG